MPHLPPHTETILATILALIGLIELIGAYLAVRYARTLVACTETVNEFRRDYIRLLETDNLKLHTAYDELLRHTIDRLLDDTPPDTM